MCCPQVHRSEGLIYMVLEYGDIDLARLLQVLEGGGSGGVAGGGLLLSLRAPLCSDGACSRWAPGGWCMGERAPRLACLDHAA